jgi:DNA-binding transcriptional MerR regulator
VSRVRLIRAALSIGFTLDELAKILRIRDAGGAPCRKVRDVVGVKLQGLEQHIQQLVDLRDQLGEVLHAWDGLLEQTPHGKPAGLLDALAASPEKPRSLPPHVYAAVMKESRR